MGNSPKVSAGRWESRKTFLLALPSQAPNNCAAIPKCTCHKQPKLLGKCTSKCEVAAGRKDESAQRNAGAGVYLRL